MTPLPPIIWLYNLPLPTSLLIWAKVMPRHHIVLSCLQFPMANLFVRLFICHQAKLTPHSSIKTPTNTLNCPYSKILTNNYANLTQPYNQAMKVKVVTKKFKKEGRLCMKLPPQRHSVQKMILKFNPLFLVLTFRVICQYPRSESLWGKLNMIQHLKPHNY